MTKSVWNFKLISLFIGLVVGLGSMPSVLAGTIVRISTSMGDYSIELLDDITPITVQNFLNYTNRDAYDSTYMHRVENNSVAQGGGFRFELFVGPIPVEPDPPIVNEFNVSNTRGTVAMAKFAGDPDSATSQWFVNLADNSANLDNQNGGFTVFANVLGDGMAVLDAIDALPVAELGSNTPSAPYITETYNNPLDFVYINAEVVERFSGAPHVYEINSGKLITSVNVDNDAALVGLNFDTITSANEVIIQANVESIIPKRDSFDGIATYSTADGRLRIPSLEIFDGNGVFILNDLVFILTDPANQQFTLESFSQ